MLKLISRMIPTLLLVACGGGEASPPTTGSGGSGAATSASSSGAGAGTSTSSSGSGGTTISSSGSGGGSAMALVSDDFESGSLDMAIWTPQLVSGGSYAVESGQAHSGNYALHVAHSGFSTMLMLQGAPLFPAPSERFFARVWFLVEGQLPSNHVIWVEAGTAQNDIGETRVGMNAGYMDVNHWPGDEDLRDPTAMLAADSWHCLELMMDGEADVLEVRLDGEPRPNLSTSDWVADDPANGNTNPLTDWSPPYEALRFGWELGNGDIWFDDVAAGHDDWLGCQ